MNKRNTTTSDGTDVLDEQVAFLTHALSPHRLALAEKIADQLAVFRVFLSQKEDKLHKFPLEQGTLDVTVQRSVNWQHSFWNVHGYADVSHMSVPYDTFTRLLNFRPTIIVSTELGIRSLLATLYKMCFPTVRVILWATLSQRTEATRGMMRKVLRPWLLARADAVFVNGRDGRRYIESLGYRGAMYAIPYAIDASLFFTRTFAPQAGKFRLLYTGQLIPRKGLLSFCLTLNQWCRDHPGVTVSLSLVGEGPERGFLTDLGRNASFAMFLYPRALQRDLMRFYDDADISVLPTLGDEWGVVVNESLSAGRPVLGSVHSQAVTELIQDGKNGWVWNPEEEGSLYKTLSRVFQASPQDLTKLSKYAVESISRVSPEAVAVEVLNALDAVTRQRSAES